MQATRQTGAGQLRIPRKILFALIACATLLALALSKTVVFTPEQIMEFLKWVLALIVGGHVATDVGALFALGRERNGKTKGS